MNFSRPGAQIIAQYYNLIHLGFTGYQDIMENTLANARLLSRALEATGWYRCVSDIHRKKGDLVYEKGKTPYEEGQNSADYNAGLPVVAFTLSDDFKKTYPHVKQESVSNVAIVDLLPGGFEVVGSSLKPGVGSAGCDYVDVREDRAVFFTEVGENVKTIEYQIKPGNRGEFVVPAVFAESMYDRAIKARGMAARITVLDPK